MFAVNRSTASTWARKSASSSRAATASGLVTRFWNDDRGRHDLLHPVLDAERAVAERDLAVLDEVGRAAGGDEVLDQRAAAAQVVADRRSGQRRHQQHRVAVLAGGGRGPVVVDLAQL